MAEIRARRHNASIQRGGENKFRQSLKSLQLSADEKGLAVGNFTHPDDKMFTKEKKSEAVKKLPVEEKENIVRCSRRAAAIKVCYTESPEQTRQSRLKSTGKTKKTKPKQGQTSKAKANKQKGALNQKKLEFETVKTDTTVIKQESENYLPQSTNEKKLDISAPVNEKKLDISAPVNEKKLNISAPVNEDSGFDPASRDFDGNPLNSTTVFQSPVLHSDISIVTEANPPLVFWKNLAEKRRVALEKALHENELLHDQLIVLETENSQLKEVVRQAENLANIIKDIVD